MLGGICFNHAYYKKHLIFAISELTASTAEQQIAKQGWIFYAVLELKQQEHFIIIWTANYETGADISSVFRIVPTVGEVRLA